MGTVFFAMNGFIRLREAVYEVTATYEHLEQEFLRIKDATRTFLDVEYSDNLVDSVKPSTPIHVKIEPITKEYKQNVLLNADFVIYLFTSFSSMFVNAKQEFEKLVQEFNETAKHFQKLVGYPKSITWQEMNKTIEWGILSGISADLVSLNQKLIILAPTFKKLREEEVWSVYNIKNLLGGELDGTIGIKYSDVVYSEPRFAEASEEKVQSKKRTISIPRHTLEEGISPLFEQATFSLPSTTSPQFSPKIRVFRSSPASSAASTPSPSLKNAHSHLARGTHPLTMGRR